jgi:hypothetical protein
MPSTSRSSGVSIRIGCGTEKLGLCRPAGVPIVLKAAIEMAGSESEDGVGATKGPEHAGLFETGTHDGEPRVRRQPLDSYAEGS